MKTQYYTASSLDGFIADPDNSLDWLLQFGDVEGSTYPEFIKQVGALCMGSTTYQWLLDNHLREGTPQEQPWLYEVPAWVFTSRKLPVAKGADIRFVQGDIAPVHREMVEAAGGKNVWVVGGGELAGQFYDRGLLDELIVQVTAVTLGGGAPVFPRRIAKPPLRVQSVRPFGGAFVEIRYEVPRT